MSKPPLSSVLVVDKSFLDAVTWPQLQYYASAGWTFGIPPVLLYEHFRKEDDPERDRRRANIFKLHKVEDNLAMLPDIGEMFREESQMLKPSRSTMRARRTTINVVRASSGKYFDLDDESRRSTEERTQELQDKLGLLTQAWHDFRRLPRLRECSNSERPKVIEELKLTIRDDIDDMRGFYSNHRHPNFPPTDMLDGDWCFFRWTQVHLLAGLDFMSEHGIDAQPNAENMFHELLDLDYLITAVLVGGLACREKRVIKRFRLLRPDGVILRGRR